MPGVNRRRALQSLAGSVLAAAAPGWATAPGGGFRFSDITQKAGLDFRYLASPTSKKYLIETMGAGVAMFDYDNDGRLDLFLVNGAPIADPTPLGTIPQKAGPAYWNRLYRQREDGRFEDVTARAGLQGEGYGMGVAVGDYDNDGNADLYVTAYGGNRLYHNNGDGTFTDVTAAAGVAGEGWCTSAAWVDWDQDGRLDLIVLRYMEWDFHDIWCGARRPGYRDYCQPGLFRPIRPLAYHNDGDGKFSEVGAAIGLGKPGKGLGIAIADYDLDGRADVFIANDSMMQFLYHNQGHGKFEEVALLAGVAVDGNGRTFAGMGVDFSDYDNDGRPDLVVTDLGNQTYALYHNDGGGNFSYATYDTGLGAMTLTHAGWGARLADFDNDGWKDLMVAQGDVLPTIHLTHPNLHYHQPMLLARNHHGRRFTNAAPAAGPAFQRRWAGRGMAIGDIDNDGRLDALVLTHDGPVHLLRNETENGHHWLQIKLVGRVSNRDGIGATVVVETDRGRQAATASTAGSYLSSSDVRLHFGLGPERRVARVEIRWPSGLRQVLRQVAAGQLLRVEEPLAASAGGPP